MQLNFNFALNLATLIQSIFQPIDVDITSATSCNVEANFQLMNTKTDYVTVANTNKESDDFTLPGCDPIGIWHLSRHGARYTDTEEMTEYSTVLTQVRDNILSKGNILRERINTCSYSNILIYLKKTNGCVMQIRSA